MYQVPLIEAAQRRGLEAIVASCRGQYPGIDLADTFVPVDIADPAGILTIAKEFKVRAVATAGADAGLRSLGCVVDKLGLYGPDEKSAFRSANKASMKCAFRNNGVPTAPFEAFMKIASAHKFADELGYPIMVKTSDSSGSRGITRVDKSDDFTAAWQEAMAHCRNQTIVVEKYLVGHEYGAQAVIHGDHVEAIFIHEDTVTPGPVSTPVGHAMPTTLTAADITRTERVITDAIAAMNLRDCVANVDLMLTDEGPQVIEIGGRMGATGIPEMINLYTGWDIYDHVLDLSLGAARPLPALSSQPNAVTLLRSDRSGMITSLEVPEEIRNHPLLVDLQWDINPGGTVRAFKVGPDRVGQLQVKANTAVKATHLAETLRMGLKIKVQESS